MKRRAAHALLVFFVAMACFGILSRAVSSAGTALVAAEVPSTQTFAQEAVDEDGGAGGGTGIDPGPAPDGEAAPGGDVPSGFAAVPDGEAAPDGNAPEASADAVAPAAAREYGSCVAPTAVHREKAQSYVYVVAEQEGFSGTELVARKVPVSVIAANESWAALAEGAVSSQQKIIVRSDRVLADGSKVRLADA